MSLKLADKLSLIFLDCACVKRVKKPRLTERAWACMKIAGWKRWFFVAEVRKGVTRRVGPKSVGFVFGWLW